MLASGPGSLLGVVQAHLDTLLGCWVLTFGILRTTKCLCSSSCMAVSLDGWLHELPGLGAVTSGVMLPSEVMGRPDF